MIITIATIYDVYDDKVQYKIKYAIMLHTITEPAATVDDNILYYYHVTFRTL